MFCKFMHGARQINVLMINLIITKKVMSCLCIIFCNNFYKNSLFTHCSIKTSVPLSILSLFQQSIFHESVNSLIVSLENQEFEMSFNMRKASFDQHLRKISLKGMSSVQYISNVGVQRMTADVWPIQSLLLWYLWGQPSHAQHMLICR